MKFSEYETVNPGQDFDDHEIELFDPPEGAVTGDEVRRPNVAAETSEQAIHAVVNGDPLSIIGSRTPGSRAGRTSGEPLSTTGSRTLGSRASRTNCGTDKVVEVPREKSPSLL